MELNPISVELPKDKDTRMVVAATLTAAVCNMDCGPQEAVDKVCEIYLKFLSSSNDTSLATWEKLGSS